MRISVILSFFISIFQSSSLKAQEQPAKDEPVIYGITPTSLDGVTFINGIPAYASKTDLEFYAYGTNLHSNVELGISTEPDCKYVDPANIISVEGKGHVGIFELTAPDSGEFFLKNVRIYICLKKITNDKWILQNTNDRTGFYVHRPLLTPFYIIIIIIVCILLSSLMSGLNIGLMSLDRNELTLLKNSGTEQERKYAKKIIPIRQNGNFLLCSILITATLCNAIATVYIENFMSTWITVAVTTVVIVLLCEIFPQSVCTYFPLAIGAYTVNITKMCMIITSPVSYPLSMILDLILGKELVETYTKERLRELLKMTCLPTNEEKIISGALELSQKRVEDIMTMLDDVFKLPITAIMNFETIALILASGYSRIPIYDGKNSNVVAVLLTKDLALLDPEDEVPVKVLLETNKFKSQYMSLGTTLDSALAQFKDSRGHMAFIVDDKDNEKAVVGLITFEDVIEEVFQMEIIDETDMVSDNRTKRKLTSMRTGEKLLSLLKKGAGVHVGISENLKLATFHFLTGIDLFSTEYISREVLLKVLGLDVFVIQSSTASEDNLYTSGVPADYFIMILEGATETKIGTEGMRFESGPFKYFGLQALRGQVRVQGEEFVPDYTLQAIKKIVYLKIPKALYDAAVLATRFERFNEVPDISIKSELYKYYNQLVGNEDSGKNSEDV